jgi:hypothetical protein
MNGRDFLPIARALAAETTEAAWRSALSRAYYAAFHVARELMEGMGFAVPKSDAAHKHMAWRLGNCGHAQVEDIGRKLDILEGTETRPTTISDTWCPERWPSRGSRWPNISSRPWTPL